MELSGVVDIWRRAVCYNTGMARLRRYLPLLILLLVILICGKLLVTPVIVGNVDSQDLYVQYDMGWPWRFVTNHKWCTDYEDVYAWSSIWKTLTNSGDAIEWLPLVANLTAIVVIAAAAFFLLKRLMRSRCGGRQFSLRSLMIGVVVVAIGLGWWSSWHSQWRTEQQLADSLGANKCFMSRPPEYTIYAQYTHDPRSWHLTFEYVGPEWARRLLPAAALDIFYRAIVVRTPESMQEKDWTELESFIRKLPSARRLEILAEPPANPLNPITFGHIEELSLIELHSRTEAGFTAISRLTQLRQFSAVTRYGESPKPVSGWLQHLSDLANLEVVDLAGTNLTDEGLLHLANCRRLKDLNLRYTQVTEEGLKHLSSHKDIESLDLAGTPISDRGLSYLARCPKLRSLTLDRTPITDAGIAHLIDLPLTSLSLDGAAISDDALESLAKVKSLERLNLNECRQLTDRGVRHLLALPNLRGYLLPTNAKISREASEVLGKHVGGE